MRRLSLRTRLAAQVALIVVVVMALVSVVEYSLLTQTMMSSVDASLRHVGSVAQAIPTESGDSIDPTVQGVVEDLAVRQGVLWQVIPSEGVPTPALDVDLPREGGSDQRKVADGVFFTADVDGVPHRVLVTQIGGDSGDTVVLARRVEDVPALQGRLRTLLWVQAGFMVILAFALGYSVTREALRPARRVAETAREIRETGDLAKRVREGAEDRDLGNLTHGFNRMLDGVEDAYTRLEASLAKEKRLVADASHELRTPLTTILGNLDYLRRTSADAGAVEDALSATRRLQNLVEGLTTLAREEAGGPDSTEIVDFDGLVHDVAAEPEWADAEVQVDVEPSVYVDGSEASLAAVVRNLLGNALKYGAAPVHVALETDGDMAVLEVKDEGPGIAAEEVPHVFDRFWRASDTKAHPGSGLGLSIVKATVEAHGGSAEAFPAPGGRFVVRLPLADPGRIPTPEGPDGGGYPGGPGEGRGDEPATDLVVAQPGVVAKRDPADAR